MDRRTLNDNDLSQFDEGKGNGVAKLQVNANENSFEELQKRFKDEVLYVHGQKIVLYVEKPKPKTRLELAEGDVKGFNKYRILSLSQGVDKELEKYIGNYVTLMIGSSMMGNFLGSSDLALTDVHNLVSIHKTI